MFILHWTLPIMLPAPSAGFCLGPEEPRNICPGENVLAHLFLDPAYEFLCNVALPLILVADGPMVQS